MFFFGLMFSRRAIRAARAFEERAMAPTLLHYSRAY